MKVTIQVETRIYCVFRKKKQIMQCLSPFAEGESNTPQQATA